MNKKIVLENKWDKTFKLDQNVNHKKLYLLINLELI